MRSDNALSIIGRVEVVAHGIPGMTRQVSQMAEIETAVDAAYGSRATPHQRFVSHERAEKRYSAVLADLQRTYALEDTTDENDDVSLVLALQLPEGCWTLYLSMVGPFATLVEWSTEAGRCVDDLTPDASPGRQAILRILGQHAVAVVRCSILFERLPIRLDDLEPAGSTVFRALFSDVAPVVESGTQR